jgi:hypothetical protein
MLIRVPCSLLAGEWWARSCFVGTTCGALEQGDCHGTQRRARQGDDREKIARAAREYTGRKKQKKIFGHAIAARDASADRSASIRYRAEVTGSAVVIV